MDQIERRCFRGARASRTRCLASRQTHPGLRGRWMRMRATPPRRRKIPGKQTAQEVGRESRPTATRTVALPAGPRQTCRTAIITEMQTVPRHADCCTALVLATRAPDYTEQTVRIERFNAPNEFPWHYPDIRNAQMPNSWRSTSSRKVASLRSLRLGT